MFPQSSMGLRRRFPDRIEPRGITPRRLSAAERALARERGKLVLFAQQVLAEQESAEERIDRMDQSMIAYDQGHRDLAARHWRHGRRMLRSLPPELQTNLIEKWNGSCVPPNAAYFADFVRTRLRRKGMDPDNLAS